MLSLISLSVGSLKPGADWWVKVRENNLNRSPIRGPLPIKTIFNLLLVQCHTAWGSIVFLRLTPDWSVWMTLYNLRVGVFVDFYSLLHNMQFPFTVRAKYLQQWWEPYDIWHLWIESIPVRGQITSVDSVGARLKIIMEHRTVLLDHFLLVKVNHLEISSLSWTIVTN